MSSSKVYPSGIFWGGVLVLLVTQRDRHPKQALGRRRGKGEKACAGKAAGTVSEQHGMETPSGKPHGGQCDFTGAVVVSGTDKKLFSLLTALLF
ncbi:hypothetical protein JQM66_12220 [Oscillibacter valericigenes]|uniref:hypothetical protein n=1 Tax=Oscillibacter valericigenes TaxID=351091 RepID=UPI001F172411|nr:hypothetical protein [Oscillibacter valericigenes]MCF2665311.1 hypothetical protein [Oscillibacter valericigenes]